MNKGYLIFATGGKHYARLAYACALSIKLTQPAGFDQVSVVTDIPDSFAEYKKVFDHVILYTGPDGMDARSRACDYTPYAETVLIDADMLFLTPMDHYWDIMSRRDMFISTSPQTYRGQKFKYGYYRRVFEENSWPDIYNAWTYFKRDSEQVQEFFKLVKHITDNPTPYIKMFMPNTLYTTVPTDEAFALALCISDQVDQVTLNWDFPRITHMKPAVQQWRDSVPDWVEKLRFSFTDPVQVKLGVWHQADLLHYVKKDLITDDIISAMEQQL